MLKSPLIDNQYLINKACLIEHNVSIELLLKLDTIFSSKKKMVALIYFSVKFS